jgi:hypothetical protein
LSSSVFAKYIPQAYPYNFRVVLKVGRIAGGTPTDPKVAEGWLKTKLVDSKDDLLREQVAEVMMERGVSTEEAAKVISKEKHLNGFKRELETGELYIEGRQVKAMIKENANIRWPKERWGPTRKGTLSFFAEHVFVPEDHVGLGVSEPSGVNQRFVHTFRGSGIQYEEYVDDAELSFTVTTDYDFQAQEWAMLWLTAEQNGLGASRSQGYGRFDVVDWKKI